MSTTDPHRMQPGLRTDDYQGPGYGKPEPAPLPEPIRADEFSALGCLGGLAIALCILGGFALLGWCLFLGLSSAVGGI